MCGRFVLFSTLDMILVSFKLKGSYDIVPRYNIAPTQNVSGVVLSAEAGGPVLKPFKWGLVPHWAKDPSMGVRMINARADSVAEKPAFRGAFRSRRCLIPADGFVEWRQDRSKKLPMLIRMKDRHLFAFAGLYEQWKAPDGSTLDSCTIITCEPNPLVTKFHTRMPVILYPESYDQWIDPATPTSAGLASLLVPYDENQMEAVRISQKINSAKNEGPECIEEVTRD
ncbi:MAG: SOS response-associated peptidase [Candidatus Brocadiia bacterium]